MDSSTVISYLQNYIQHNYDDDDDYDSENSFAVRCLNLKFMFEVMESVTSYYPYFCKVKHHLQEIEKNG